MFQKFVDDLEQSHDIEALRHTMKSAAAAFDLAVFAYLAMPATKSGSPTLISTYPARWTDHYLRSRYEAVDPVVVRAHTSREPFPWGLEFGPTRMTRRQKQIFDEASEFDIRCGFTIPVHDGRGVVAAISFASDRHRPAFDRGIAEHRRVLQLMAAYFHAHVRRKITAPCIVAGVRLSPREYECLQWTSKGKSAWDIARILGISANTVTFYLANAKAKLGVRTRYQAVALLGKNANTQ